MKKPHVLYDVIIDIMASLPNRLWREKADVMQHVLIILVKPNFKASDCREIHKLILSLTTKLKIAEQEGVMAKIATLCN